MSLGFDENVTKRLEIAYQKGDVVRRRAAVRDALDVQPGDDVVDVGCGPGFYVAELADVAGSVLGIDTSPQMLAVAAKRSEGRGNVTFREGDAMAIPAEDGSFDRALSVQVFEYVSDVPKALGEMRRVLRPGGRALIWDIDWATLSWYSSDPDRMERVMRAWDEHLVHSALPQTLAKQMREAGFEDVTVEGHVFVNTVDLEEGYSLVLVPMIADFASGRSGVSAEDAQAWKEDLLALAERGDYYFSVTQFCFTARK
jgi:arsenite methyltransferase